MLGRTLHERLGKLAEHFAKLGRSLGNAVDSYNSAVGSFETRVLTTARKFEDLKASAENSTLPSPDPIDSTPRNLQNSGAGVPAAATIAPPAPITLSLSAESLLAPAMDDDDFTFVPDPPASARSAAADLRSALE